MTKSVRDSAAVKALLKSALTDRINDREMLMKGIDYSYYYEQEDDIMDGERMMTDEFDEVGV
jgi:cell filamentation protein